ncbi:MAG: sugar ABC transporter permease [Clostridia bacterium]|nr:sugar ABC transporter permease [Clostridia bacterium]
MTQKLKNNLKKHLFVYSILIYPLIMFAVFWVGINFNSVIMAFQYYDKMGNVTGFAGFNNFIEFFKNLAAKSADITIRTGVINSIRTFCIGLIGYPISVIVAYCLYKKVLFYKVYRFIVMIPQIVSGFVLTLVFHKFVENALPSIMNVIFNLEDFPNLLGDARYTYGTSLFFSIWSGLAGTILLFTSSLNNIDVSIIESARLDGANFFQEMWFICVPLIGGIIGTGFITNISSLFTAEGPLVAFWEFGAPPEVMNIGYYFTQQVMRNKDNFTGYPMLAAMGLVFTAVTVPLVYLVKGIINKVVPEV